jgi:thymidylate kinase
LVALSGIDGAGKSSQARWLADSMTALGIDGEVVWNNLLGNRALNFVAAAPKALLGRTGGAGERIARYEDAASPSGGSPLGSAIHGVWSTVVTLSNAIEQRVEANRAARRHRVVIFDRSPLDLAVRMHVLYRGDVERLRRLVRLLAPQPDLAFLLDIPAEVSLRRKSDIWSPSQLHEQAALYRSLAPRFTARRLDGQLPPEEIAAEIAREAWLALD